MKFFYRKNIHSKISYIRRVVYVGLGSIDKIVSKNKNLITILSYHSISDDDWLFSIDQKTIKKQILFLRENYDFVGLSDLERFLNGKKDIKKQSVVLTFDDGYKDILKIKSFLKIHNIKPALFILSSSQSADGKELGTKRSFLKVNEIKSLIADGWEIGSHSATHKDLTNLSKDELIKEIVESKKDLEKELSIKIKYFAYPRGKYTKEILNIVKKAKYNLALTMDDSILTRKTNVFKIPRVGVDRSHSFVEFKNTNSYSNIQLRNFLKRSYLGKLL